MRGCSPRPAPDCGSSPAGWRTSLAVPRPRAWFPCGCTAVRSGRRSWRIAGRRIGFAKPRLGSCQRMAQPHLAPRLAMAEVYGTIMPHDYQVFLWYAKRRGTGLIPNGDTLASIAVQFAVLRGDESLAGGRLTRSSGGAGRSGRSAGAPEDVSLWRLSGPLPRAWLAPRAEVLPPLATGNWRILWRRTGEVFYPEGRGAIIARSASSRRILTNWPARGFPRDFGAGRPCRPPARRQHSRRLPDRPLRADSRGAGIRLSRGGLVVLADQYYPGWTQRIETAGQGGAAPQFSGESRHARGLGPRRQAPADFPLPPPTVFGAAPSAWQAGWG